MRVLVTGGAGYIGSATTHQLIANGAEVIVFDNLYQGHREAVPAEAVFIEGDLAHQEIVEAVFEQYDIEAVMHFASHTLVGESMEQPFLYLRDNVVNALNLLETAVKFGTRKFILSSTANLFDEPENMPIPPTDPIVPGSPYGESKFIIERLLHWMDEIYGLRYAALRYFNACGAISPDVGEHHDPETHIIPLVLDVALGKREKIFIFGNDYDTPDGTCVRDYIHVYDLAQAHILALHALDKGSRTYNLGNGRGYSLLELVETARKVTGHPIPMEFAPRRPGDPAILIADSEQINHDLDWRPKYADLESIISSAWAWHSKNPQGYSE